jgi:hydroxymethylbilane synthase
MAALRIGTRASVLARTQSQQVADQVNARTGRPVELVSVTTEGDVNQRPLTEFGGAGVFVSALREALLAGEVDVAVHSLKDLPTAAAPGITLAAVPAREDPRDAVVARDGLTLAELPPGSRIGTGSPRRASQLLALGLGFDVQPVRGNVGTRIGYVTDGRLDAVVLAYAGLRRVGRADEVTEIIDPLQMLPAPGQGALAVECRSNDPGISRLLDPINHPQTLFATTAERAFLKGLGGGCSSPVAAFGWFEADELHLQGRVIATDGSAQVEVHGGAICASAGDARQLGHSLAEEALSRGAGKLVGASA